MTPEEEKKAVQEAVLLDSLGTFANLVATWSGMRKQLMDDGWTQDHAEQVIIAALRSGG